MSAPRSRPSLLIVDDDRHVAEQLSWALGRDYAVERAGDREAALAALERLRPDVLLVDLCLPPDGTPEEGFRILRAARAADVTTLVMSGLEERTAALRAIREGAYDFFGKPVDLDAVRVVVRRALERRTIERENRELRRQLHERFGLEGVVGTSAAMLAVFDAVRRVAGTPITVILLGESGTGKGLVARAIHQQSQRAEGPFVALHCAALPESLLEAELFGHEKGAFTGATGARVGRFEAASGGTLFLDEIGCLTPAIQVKLLRVLEERVVERLGSNETRPVDFRLIVATNEDLEERARQGAFRQDLLFRVKVFPVHLPPLRERRADVPLLAEEFLRQAARDSGRHRSLSVEAARELMARDWPGNVRELRNVLETLTLLADGESIGAEDVRLAAPLGVAPPDPVVNGQGFKQAMHEFERRFLVEAIRRADGVKARAARDLGLDASQMKYLTRKHGL